MSTLGRLYRGDTNIDFRPLWRVSVPLSVGLAVVSILLLLVRGLDLTIDFQGGGVWEVPVPAEVTVGDARAAIGLDEGRVQLVDDPQLGLFLRVQSGSDDAARSAEIVGALADLAGVSPDEVSVATASPTWGSQITGKAVRALVFFFVAVAFYLAWRLEWRMAAGALIAVVHDLAITVGVYSLFAFDVSPATVIALLTILGYSLYDTVVVYDKVLENEGSPSAEGRSPTGVINAAMNQVLMRSINTTLTTVLPVGSMLIVGGIFLGGATLREFALALFIGLLLGAYSSIFVAAPVLSWLRERDADTEPEDARGRRRRPATVDVGDTESAGGAGGAGSVSAAITPRARKKKRR